MRLDQREEIFLRKELFIIIRDMKYNFIALPFVDGNPLN